jgi:hypothetical protein
MTTKTHESMPERSKNDPFPHKKMCDWCERTIDIFCRMQRRQRDSDNENKRLLELNKGILEFEQMMENKLNVIHTVSDVRTKKLNDTLIKLAALQLKWEGYENKHVAKGRRNTTFAVTFMVFGFFSLVSFLAFRGLPLCVLGAWTLLSLVSAG